MDGPDPSLLGLGDLSAADLDSILSYQVIQSQANAGDPTSTASALGDQENDGPSIYDPTMNDGDGDEGVSWATFMQQAGFADGGTGMDWETLLEFS